MHQNQWLSYFNFFTATAINFIFGIKTPYICPFFEEITLRKFLSLLSFFHCLEAWILTLKSISKEVEKAFLKERLFMFARWRNRKLKLLGGVYFLYFDFHLARLSFQQKRLSTHQNLQNSEKTRTSYIHFSSHFSRPKNYLGKLLWKEWKMNEIRPSLIAYETDWSFFWSRVSKKGSFIVWRTVILKWDQI